MLISAEQSDRAMIGSIANFASDQSQSHDSDSILATVCEYLKKPLQSSGIIHNQLLCTELPEKWIGKLTWGGSRGGGGCRGCRWTQEERMGQ
jgi:hypothetical protein